MSGKRARTLALVAIALVLGVLGTVWATSRAPAELPAVAPSPQKTPLPAVVAEPARSPSAPSRPADGTRAWIPGTLYRYALSADQKISFRPVQAGMAALPGMRFNLEGEWDVGVVSATPERIDARVNLKLSSLRVDVDGNGPLAPDVQRNLSTALQLPFFLTFDKTGLVKFTHFEQGADVLVRGILRGVVASSQFVVAGAPGETWGAEELDTTGQYHALYQRLGARRFEKRKLSYSHITSPQGLEPLGSQIQISVNAKATFELEEDLWIHSLQGSEHVDVEAGQAMPPTTYEFSLSLSLRERLQDPTLIGSFEARRAFLGTAAMSSFQGVEQDPMDQYRQVLGDKNFDSLLAELRSLPKEPKERDDVRSRVLEQLRALFMLQPAEALKVPGIIRAGMDPLAASPMLGALSAATTREAIHSLAEVTGDRSIPNDIRMDAVAALGVAADPTSEGLEALHGMGQDADPMLRDTAKLALGNAAFQLGDTDKRGSEALIHELNSEYSTAPSAEAQALALRSLGNTRSPGALATLQEALQSGDPQIRAAALEALRNIPDPMADQLLSKHLLGDPAPEVRRTAVFASSFRPLAPLLPALAQALRTDPSDGVRLDVVHLLGDQRAVVPEAMPLLRQASENDASAEVRQAASTLVNTPATGTPTPLPSP